MSSEYSVAVVVPNWNGKDVLPACLDSLLAQTQKAEIIVVENGSIDGSKALVEEQYPSVTLLPQEKNLGFDGGVNVGINHALAKHHTYIALFNNDAVAEPTWLEELTTCLENNTGHGIATGKLMDGTRTHLDSTGDLYTVWGLACPRGRGTEDTCQYDTEEDVFGATGGATVYRAEMFRKIGIFDNDFFAYYEDVDISFRAQLAGWKVRYVPRAVAYHQIGQTSGKIKGFTTYQTIKNLPWVMWKNVPFRLLPTVFPRFFIAHTSFIVAALGRGQFSPVIKGVCMTTVLFPKKLLERRRIQSEKAVTDTYIRSLLVWDLPPNAARLRKIRAMLRKLFGNSFA